MYIYIYACITYTIYIYMCIYIYIYMYIYMYRQREGERYDVALCNITFYDITSHISRNRNSWSRATPGARRRSRPPRGGVGGNHIIY